MQLLYIKNHKRNIYKFQPFRQNVCKIRNKKRWVIVCQITNFETLRPTDHQFLVILKIKFPIISETVKVRDRGKQAIFFIFKACRVTVSSSYLSEISPFYIKIAKLVVFSKFWTHDLEGLSPNYEKAPLLSIDNFAAKFEYCCKVWRCYTL